MHPWPDLNINAAIYEYELECKSLWWTGDPSSTFSLPGMGSTSTCVPEQEKAATEDDWKDESING